VGRLARRALERLRSLPVLPAVAPHVHLHVHTHG
jgi:hypothetical protein